MWNGKKKALTFSYDDGVLQDAKLIELFDKYGMKATFNLNSCLLGGVSSIVRNDIVIRHDKVKPGDVRELYKNHEIAAHTQYHRNLTTQSEEDITAHIRWDIEALSALAGYEVRGMAYPCGGVNCDDRVEEVIRRTVPELKYARTIISTHSFDMPGNLIRLNPSVYHLDIDIMDRLADEFISASPDKPMLFYVWGHSYEFDGLVDMVRFGEILSRLAFRDDVFYGTNGEVLA